MFRTSIKTCGTSLAHDIRPATVFKHHSQHAVLSGRTEQKLESGGTVRSRVVRVGCLCAQVVDVRVLFFFAVLWRSGFQLIVCQCFSFSGPG